jgi:hypothetical protein
MEDDNNGWIVGTVITIAVMTAMVWAAAIVAWILTFATVA